MRSKTIILVILLAMLAIPVVHAEDSQDWYIKGQNAATAGNYADAISYYNKALTLDKNYASAMAGMAAASNSLGKYEDALTLSEQALALRGSDPTALNARAFALFNLGRYDEAVSAYDKLFTVQNNNVDAYCNQGYAYLQMKEYDAAILPYDRCTAIDPYNFMSWNYKGLAYMGSMNYDQALSSFDRATGITVKNATLWNNKGLVYVQLKRPQDASECFKKALGIDPNFAEAQKNRDSTVGKLQIVNISGTVTPTVTISRIGTFYTTATPVPPPTETITSAPGTTSEVTAIATVGTTAVSKKTTYSPLFPLTAFGAIIVVSGLAFALNRKKK
jgi:tetratricopeptide (TPR) repeat protein